MAKKSKYPYSDRDFAEVHNAFANVYKDGVYFVSEAMCRRWYGRLRAKAADHLKELWDRWVSDRTGKGRLVGPHRKTIERQRRKALGEPVPRGAKGIAFMVSQPKLLIVPLKRPSDVVLVRSDLQALWLDNLNNTEG